MDGLLGNLFGIQEEDPLLAMLPPEQRARLQAQTRSQGITNLGLALLQAGGPTRTPGGVGAMLGQAGMQAMQANQGLMDANLQRLLAARKMQQEQAQLERQKQFRTGLTGMMRTETVQPPVVDQEGRPGAGVVQPAFTRTAFDQDAATRLALEYPEFAQEAAALRKIVEPEAFTLAPGQVRMRGGEVIAAAPFEPEKPREAPGVVGEFQSALNLGLIPQGTTLSQYVEMKKPPAPSATAIVGDKESEFQKAASRKSAETWTGIQSAGFNARRTLGDVNRLGSILNRLPTGLTASVKQVAGNFGIKTEGLDDIQAATAIINRLVPQQRQPGSGTMSDADLALFKESLPRIINQPGGNQKIINTLKAVNEYLVKEGQIADKVLSGEISTTQGAEQIAALANPLEEVIGEEENRKLTPRGRKALDKYK